MNDDNFGLKSIRDRFVKPTEVSTTVEIPEAPPETNQEYEIVSVNDISPHPNNARKGNLNAIRESIKSNGFYGVCVVQRSSSHILIGNHRYLAAVEEGLTEVPVIWVDKSDNEARAMLLVDNRTSDLGTYDQELLMQLLEDQNNEQDLLGTGWVEDDISKLLDSISDPEPPEGWASFDEDLQTEHTCPKCGYEF
tara:strand:+ start:977 stop:1558 length:582 start_codon:yes stop_codon:yes gene_type:complete